MSTNQPHIATPIYDVLVIGSGLGGLISGLLLAMEGKKVCILEKNNQYGGNLQTFVREKTIFDTGVHYIGGLGEGENLNRYFSYLGILSALELEQLAVQGFDHITFENEQVSYKQAQGYDLFVATLLKHFPEEKVALDNYVKALQDVCNHFPMYHLKEGKGYTEEILEVSCAQFFDRLTTNKKLQSVLLGNSFLYAGQADSTPFYVHALCVNSYIVSAWRCLKGGSQISKILVQKLREYGADLYKHQKVEACLVDNHTITACKTATHTYWAKNFISNIDLKQTLRLVGAASMGKAYTKRIESLQVVPSVFSVHLVLHPNSIPYFNYNIYHHKSHEEPLHTHNPWNEQWPHKYVITTNAKTREQMYCDQLTVMTYMDFDEVKPWEQTFNTHDQPAARAASYEAFKAVRAQKIIEALRWHFPNIDAAIQSVHVSTPLTYRDYIGNEKGTMYGFAKEAAFPMKTMISPKTKINNLFLTGQNVRMHGLLGVTINAFAMCSELLGGEDFMKKVRNK